MIVRLVSTASHPVLINVCERKNLVSAPLHPGFLHHWFWFCFAQRTTGCTIPQHFVTDTKNMSSLPQFLTLNFQWSCYKTNLYYDQKNSHTLYQNETSKIWNCCFRFQKVRKIILILLQIDEWVFMVWCRTKY